MAQLKKNFAENQSSQFHHHLKCILKSGLLLDEDMDCILMNYHGDEKDQPDKKFSLLQKLWGGLSLSSILIMIQGKLPLLYMPVTASPLLFIGFQHLRVFLYRGNQKRNTEILIQALCDMSKVNRMIVEYFKLRNISSPTTVKIVNPYTQPMRELIEVIFKEEVNLLYALRIFVRQFGTYVPSLKQDYAYLENIELEEFSTNNVHNINNCVAYLQKLCDIFVLVASNCLTCLAITLTPSIWAKFDININEILDSIVPKMKTMSVNCFNTLNKKFDDVKYYYLNRTKVHQERKPLGTSSSRLHMGTCNMMAHTSDILEKSQLILNKLQKCKLNTQSEKEELGSYIAELRGDVFDYYESLDVLHKLYEVHINQPKPVADFKKEPIFPSTQKSSLSVDGGFIDASLNPSEPSDDEEYELYIGANESVPDAVSFSYYEEQESRRYASLLSQELKYKLKTHAQFVAARKKRGIIDEEPETKKEDPPEIVQVKVNEESQTKEDLQVQAVEADRVRPEFQIPKLPPPIAVPVPLPNCDEFNPKNLVPPPPPPPLPPIDLGPYGDMAGTPYTVVDDFLESIKAASKDRQSREDVFETSSTDEE